MNIEDFEPETKKAEDTLLVTVIITTCKGTEKLVRAIESVLNQTYQNIEMIVVDDNGFGTDIQKYTSSLLIPYESDPRVKYIPHDVNKNGAAARNTGIKASKGEYIAFLDDDDIFLPERIEKLVSTLVNYNTGDTGNSEKNEIGSQQNIGTLEQCVAVISDVLFLSGRQIQSEMKCQTKGFSPEELFINQNLLGTGSNIFVRKDIVNRLNGFDERFTRYQDIEFMLRVAETGAICGVNEYLVVKDITDVRFFPEYTRFQRNQNMLLEKFSYLLTRMNDKDARQCLYAKRKELLSTAYTSGKKENVEKALKAIENDGLIISKKELTRIKLRSLYIRYVYKILAPLREIKHRKDAQNLEKEIGKQKIDSILTWIVGMESSIQSKK